MLLAVALYRGVVRVAKLMVGGAGGVLVLDVWLSGGVAMGVRFVYWHFEQLCPRSPKIVRGTRNK